MMTPNYDYGVQTNYMLFLFFIFLLLSLCYQYNQKTGVALFDSLNWLKIEFGHAQIGVSKIGISMLKIACINPWTKIILEMYIFEKFQRGHY